MGSDSCSVFKWVFPHTIYSLLVEDTHWLRNGVSLCVQRAAFVSSKYKRVAESAAGCWHVWLAVPGQDFLHQDLNNRLLAAHRGPESGPLPPSPFLRTAAEAAAHNHHQHMHNHQHMHQHNSFNGLGQPSSLVPTPPPHLVSDLVIGIVTTVVIFIITVTITTAAVYAIIWSITSQLQCLANI